MKKVCTVLAGVIISAAAFSQVSFGVQGIGNLSTASVNTEQVLNPSKKLSLSPGAGLVAHIGVSDKFAVITGINYLQHGFKLSGSLEDEVGEDIASIKFDAKTKLNYLQVPVNFVYKIPSEYHEFYIGAGPYLSYGLSGKMNITTTTTIIGGEPLVEKEEAKAFAKEVDGGGGLKRTDFGVGVIAGIKVANGFFAHVGYQLGLSNNSGSEDSKYKNRGLQLSVGYFFKR